VRGAPHFIGLAALASLVLAAGASFATAGDSGEAETAATVERGALLYRVYCTNCHGEDGKGDGPTAEVLQVPPADLTALRSSADGEFPRERVHAAIDGRERVRGHGASRMPIWGLGFQELDRDTNQEDEVRDKIVALIAYLESIQDGE
jgi:mono/diheme cytochrome c family protein